MKVNQAETGVMIQWANNKSTCNFEHFFKVTNVYIDSLAENAVLSLPDQGVIAKSIVDTYNKNKSNNSILEMHNGIW